MARKRAKRAKSSHVPTEVLKPASAPTIIRTRKVRKGDLKYMLDMPMDVLQEVRGRRMHSSTMPHETH